MQNLVKSKKMYKWIRKQCEKLPEKEYTAFPRQFGIPPEYRALRKVMEDWYAVPTEYPVNHYRRAKRMYKKLGLSGVDHYFRSFGFQLSTLNLQKE